MSKRKHGPTIVPALSAKVDNKEKRFIQVGNSLLLSKQFHALSTGSRFLYFRMAMGSGQMDQLGFIASEAVRSVEATVSQRNGQCTLAAPPPIGVVDATPK